MTPAIRYSYLVGAKEPTHTAQKRLLSILKDDSKLPTIDEIEDIFSVEKVTNEFFEQYKEKYLQLKEHLQQNNEFIVETRKLGLDVDKFAEQFSKKLMGQIAFLYFLQKKGWLGVRILPKNRMLSLEEYKDINKKIDLKSKDILNKVFKYNSNCKAYYMDSQSFKELSEDQAIRLSMCFNNTKFDKTWGTGDKQFIRGLFKFCEENTELNFFDDYLEPFFYEALNTKRKNSYYQRFNCKIPFLNGGLFEPIEDYHWEEISFEIPNSIFSNQSEKGMYSDGILDIFDRYNFTMNEAEPLEKEVAVDPEMLGKIFENLLDVNDRKSKGAFYTPREIVHYMCQESLINYLVNKVGVPYGDIKEFILYGEMIRDEDGRIDVVREGKELRIKSSIYKNIVEIDEALKTVKVADPAVGSGAFPLGMLNEIVKARNNITEYIIKINKEGQFGKKYDESFIRNRRSQYKMKWETIRNCIFAVDIEPSAVDISKLRLWLSVVVEQEIDVNNPKPHTLPNLDQNIMVGNSLIDEFEGIKLFDKTLRYKKNNKDKRNINVFMQMNMLLDQSDELLDNMFKLQDQYFDEDNEHRKKTLKVEIEKIRDELIRYKLQNEGNIEGLRKYEESLKKKTKPYFIWELEFAKVFKDNGGFDIVIGNPPYIGESGNKELFREIRTTDFGKKYYRGKMDFWYFFTSKAINILRKNGFLSFIAPNNWMTTFGGENMRKHVMEEMTIKNFISFGDYKVFENADQQTMIFILEKDNEKIQYKVKCSILDEEVYYIEDFTRLQIIGNHYNSFLDRKEYLEGENITFLEYSVAKIINKIKEKGKFKLDKNEAINGIHPHHASVTKKMLKTIPNKKVGDGIFVISEEEKQYLNLDSHEIILLKPYYDSNKIWRYGYNCDNSHWIIYTDSSFKDKNKMSKYKNIKKHLDEYETVITSDNKPYGLHRSRNENFFRGKKVLSIRKCSKPTFSYIDFNSYVTAEYFVIKTNRINLKYLVGILNSKLVEYWLKYKGKMQGNNYQIDKGPLLEIPIAFSDKKRINNIIELVDKRINNQNLEEIEKVECEINEIVYSIYNMDDREIKKIEDTI